MPVKDLLARVDSYELTEWMAYERAFGPIGNAWRDETLASIHEQIQTTNSLLGAAHFEENPIEPERCPRPNEVWPNEDDDEDNS